MLPRRYSVKLIIVNKTTYKTMLRISMYRKAQTTFNGKPLKDLRAQLCKMFLL